MKEIDWLVRKIYILLLMFVIIGWITYGGIKLMYFSFRTFIISILR